MSPLRFACLILAIMVSLLSVDACFAQSARKGTSAASSVVLSEGSSETNGEADSAAANSEIVGTTSGEFSSVGFSSAAAVNADGQTSVLRGAGCGTIGPQGLGDSNAVASPMIPTPEGVRPRSQHLPPIPTLLFFTLTITASAWGLRDMAKRRRITIINAGVVAAAVVTAAGFTWSIFHQEEVEYGHFTQAGEAATNLAYLR